MAMTVALNLNQGAQDEEDAEEVVPDQVMEC